MCFGCYVTCKGMRKSFSVPFEIPSDKNLFQDIKCLRKKTTYII